MCYRKGISEFVKTLYPLVFFLCTLFVLRFSCVYTKPRSSSFLNIKCILKSLPIRNSERAEDIIVFESLVNSYLICFDYLIWEISWEKYSKKRKIIRTWKRRKDEEVSRTWQMKVFVFLFFFCDFKDELLKRKSRTKEDDSNEKMEERDK